MLFRSIYDPSTGVFTPAGYMNNSRAWPSMTVLNDGRVLVAGGRTGGYNGNFTDLSTAEVYDPAAGVFTYTGPMSAARFWHTATLLNGGRVLMSGGYDSPNTADIYDPRSGAFTAMGALTHVRYQHTATLLTSGQVLIAGGSAEHHGAV